MITVSLLDVSRSLLIFLFAGNIKFMSNFQKKRKKISQANGFADPFENNEEDDDVARIAKEFERKYGNAYAGSGSIARGTNNIYDKGSGYDENDEFIDNTEAVSAFHNLICSFVILLQ